MDRRVCQKSAGKQRLVSGSPSQLLLKMGNAPQLNNFASTTSQQLGGLLKKTSVGQVTAASGGSTGLYTNVLCPVKCFSIQLLTDIMSAIYMEIKKYLIVIINYYNLDLCHYLLRHICSRDRVSNVYCSFTLQKVLKSR